MYAYRITGIVGMSVIFEGGCGVLLLSMPPSVSPVCLGGGSGLCGVGNTCFVCCQSCV